MSARESQPVSNLAAIEVGGTTRADFLVRTAVAAGALYGLGAVAPHVERALAQTGAGDTDVARFALRFEQVQAAYYSQALARVPDLRGDARSATSAIRTQERQHVRELKQLIVQLGGTPVEDESVRFGGAFASRASFLRTAERLEDITVGAYNGAIPRIFSRSVLVVLGEMVQVEGRQAAVIRDLEGENVAPEAFDEPLDTGRAERLLAPYLA